MGDRPYHQEQIGERDEPGTFADQEEPSGNGPSTMDRDLYADFPSMRPMPHPGGRDFNKPDIHPPTPADVSDNDEDDDEC